METEGVILIVRGADVLDGTPVYDIKPYLSYSDSHPDARNGFGEETKDYKLKVEWGSSTPQHSTPIPTNSPCPMRERVEDRVFPYSQIEEILSQDPRPAYQEDPERIYKLDYAGWKVSFRVDKGVVYVESIAPTSNPNSFAD